MSKYFIVLFICMFFSIAHADEAHCPTVPSLISDVETHRVGKYVVRLTRSFSDEGFLFIELLEPPKFSLVDRKVIDKITIFPYGRKRILDFRETASTSIEKLNVSKGIITFQVDFYVLRGGHYLSECSVDARLERIAEPVCHHIPDQE